MRTYNVTLEQSLIHVIKARPCVLPNDGFLKQLILYDRFLVDRRRHREQRATTEKVLNNTTTEIPIQNKPSVISQVITPRDSSVNKTTNETKKSSIDSIHVIPIQVSSDISHLKKVRCFSLLFILIIQFYSD